MAKTKRKSRRLVTVKPQFLKILQGLERLCADVTLACQDVANAEDRYDAALRELNTIVNQFLLPPRRWVPAEKVKLIRGKVYLLRAVDGSTTQLSIQRWALGGWRQLWTNLPGLRIGGVEVLMPLD